MRSSRIRHGLTYPSVFILMTMSAPLIKLAAPFSQHLYVRKRGLMWVAPRISLSISPRYFDAESIALLSTNHTNNTQIIS
ncbi:MAG: hypothetical protein J3R72DRAFT_450931 [Linnemannia gamsii]|nr:MAG: hypothetical protein J3R72DRAFT_450931 [Linnemannia gamsii]